MGKTVESYRVALEEEINRWNGFARALRKDDREAFEELFDTCRGFASEGNNATQPAIFEPMVISIILAQHKKLRDLEYGLDEVLWRKICNHEQSSTPENNPTGALTIPEKPNPR